MAELFLMEPFPPCTQMPEQGKPSSGLGNLGRCSVQFCPW